MNHELFSTITLILGMCNVIYAWIVYDLLIIPKEKVKQIKESKPSEEKIKLKADKHPVEKVFGF